MKKQIKLNSEIGVDLEKLIEGGMVILANSGGGKSYLIRRIAEQAVANVQIILIDPEGEFASLREQYDFILAGKDADVPAEPRSAALLATKLLELNKSAVIDLYELHPQERQRFVKLFCDALVNCPKALYHPVIIILDEAHEYVPEGKPSEATWAVESLASKGRKRGQRLILASQRISKLSKNAAAECNNKLIGRASQDIDMKRAGDELGFSKEKLVQLRQLKPGEFFAFGPAISDEVIKLKIGEVKTAHAKVGYKGAGHIPPASEVIQKVLGELKDLPAEAEKEARTAAEMKAQITQLKRELTQSKQKVVHDMTVPTKMIERAVKEAISVRDAAWKESHKQNVRFVEAAYKKFQQIKELAESMNKVKPEKIEIHKIPMQYSNTLKRPVVKELLITNMHVPKKMIEDHFVGSSGDISVKFGAGERKVLIAIAQHENGVTREQLTVLTGYKRSTRDAYVQRLNQNGYVDPHFVNGRIVATEAGITKLGTDFEPLPTGDALRDHVLRTLPEGEARILENVLQVHPESIDREKLTEITGYQRSTRDAYIQRLNARELVVSVGKRMVRASDNLFS